MKKQFLVIFLIPNLWDYRGTKVVWGYGINAETSIHLSFKEKKERHKKKGKHPVIFAHFVHGADKVLIKTN